MRALDRIDSSSLSTACPVACYCQAASTLKLILKTSTHITRTVHLQKIKNMPLVKIETSVKCLFMPSINKGPVGH